MGARWTAFIGDDELAEGSVALRDMATDTPERVSTQDAIGRIVSTLREENR
jgi:histidyl-tRNA synthetase